MDAKQAAWNLHLENVQLRGENAALREQLAKREKRIEYIDRQLRDAKQKLYHYNVYRRQIRRLVGKRA
jgi:hypothetical protein